MAKFAISTDSNSDLYADEIKELGIYVGHLNFTIEKGKETLECVDDFKTYDEYVNFYKELRNGGVARTSILNLQAHIDLFTQMAEDGVTEALHIAQSDGLSPTIDNALKAIEIVKEKYPNIDYRALESKTTTIGEGILVKLACRLRDEGKSRDEVYDIIQPEKMHVQHFVLVDDLMYLKRGGRIGGASAAIGTLLSIKPIIEFNKLGKLEIVRKEKGMKKALKSIVDEFNKFTKNDKYFDIVIVHTDNEPLANTLADMLEPVCGVRPQIRIMGPIIGAHVGPNAVAYGFVSNEERPY
ncbi:MAG: DegV family protein [Clostridia bacterium]|nr:DegV family protein [Clostridia bacterium]